jgi:hypothetical protein
VISVEERRGLLVQVCEFFLVGEDREEDDAVRPALFELRVFNVDETGRLQSARGPWLSQLGWQGVVEDGGEGPLGHGNGGVVALPEHVTQLEVH